MLAHKDTRKHTPKVQQLKQDLEQPPEKENLSFGAGYRKKERYILEHQILISKQFNRGEQNKNMWTFTAII